jgi:hypothetical protein
MENRQSSSAIRANKWKAKLKRNTGASERGPPAEPRLKEWRRDRLDSSPRKAHEPTATVSSNMRPITRFRGSRRCKGWSGIVIAGVPSVIRS